MPHPIRMSHRIHGSTEPKTNGPRQVRHRVTHSKRASSASGGIGSPCTGTLQGRTMEVNSTRTRQNRHSSLPQSANPRTISSSKHTTSGQPRRLQTTSSSQSRRQRITKANHPPTSTRQAPRMQATTTEPPHTRRSNSLDLSRQRPQKTGYLRPRGAFPTACDLEE